MRREDRELRNRDKSNEPQRPRGEQARNRESGGDQNEHDRSVRNTEIKRETQTSGAMGRLPGSVNEEEER